MTDGTGLEPPEDQPKSAPEDRAATGPLDESEANPVRPYVDLGGLRIPPQADLGMRLELEDATQRVVAVTLELGGSTLQVQPFAAPRSSGLWHEVRDQIAEQLRAQGADLQEVEGGLGPELRVTLPPEPGTTGARAARFVGVDGPRWLLRGVITGPAATTPADAARIDELFRSVVVVRGGQPMPPRELIPLHVPAGAGTPGAGPASSV